MSNSHTPSAVKQAATMQTIHAWTRRSSYWSSRRVRAEECPDWNQQTAYMNTPAHYVYVYEAIKKTNAHYVYVCGSSRTIWVAACPDWNQQELTWIRLLITCMYVYISGVYIRVYARIRTYHKSCIMMNNERISREIGARVYIQTYTYSMYIYIYIYAQPCRRSHVPQILHNGE